jgi:hypothetical protein
MFKAPWGLLLLALVLTVHLAMFLCVGSWWLVTVPGQ